MSEDNPVRYEVEAGIAIVTIDRPERENALSCIGLGGCHGVPRRRRR